MKTAVLYSGNIRTLAETIDNNIAFFKSFSDEIDLYFSIWDHVGYIDHLNAPDYIKSKRIIDSNILVDENFVLNIVPKNVNIKHVNIERFDFVKFDMELINGLSNGLASQYYKMFDCFNLLDDSIEYDLIVRMRCDIIFNNTIEKNFLKELISNDKIIFNKYIWYQHEKTDINKSINEMVWFSNMDNMKKACNIYNNSDEINLIISDRNMIDLNYGESVCYMNLEVENLTKKISLYDFDYRVLR